MDIQHIVVPEAGKDYPRNWNAFLTGSAPKRLAWPIWSGCAGRKNLSARRVVFRSRPTAPVGGG